METNKTEWNEADYLAFVQYLNSIARKDTAAFSSKIIPGARNILGVTIPELRKSAKKIMKGDWRGFLAKARDDSLEEVLIQGIIIGQAKVDSRQLVGLIEGYLPKIDNWAVCDCFCASLKSAGGMKEEMLMLIKKCLLSKKEYHIRFAIVMLLTYYVDEDYIEFSLRTLNKIKENGYYIKMALAWAISECYVKFPAKTMDLLSQNELDDFTFNKAIDKINDSFRVDSESKRRLKQMRRPVKKEAEKQKGRGKA